MRRLFVILAVLSVLPLAAQTEDDARQFQKLAQVFRYLSGLYVDEVEMKPVVEGAITGRRVSTGNSAASAWSSTSCATR